jgi:hypothetical protein
MKIKFGSVRLQRATKPGPTGKKKTTWGKIFGVMVLVLVLLDLLVLVLGLVLLPPCIGGHLLVSCCRLLLLVLL